MKRSLSVLIVTGLVLTAAAQAATMYEVKPGESLWHISQQFLGNGNRWSEVHQANQPNISNPDQIEKGQKLKIPAQRQPTQVPPPKKAPAVKKIKPSAPPSPIPYPKPVKTTAPLDVFTPPSPQSSTLDGTPFVVDFKSLTGPPDPWCEPQ